MNRIQAYGSIRIIRTKRDKEEQEKSRGHWFFPISSHSRFDLGDQFDQLLTMSSVIRHLVCQWSNLDYQPTDIWSSYEVWSISFFDSPMKSFDWKLFVERCCLWNSMESNWNESIYMFNNGRSFHRFYREKTHFIRWFQGEYAHVDVSEYLSKPRSTPSDQVRFSFPLNILHRISSRLYRKSTKWRRVMLMRTI